MRLRHVPEAQAICDESPYVIHDPRARKGGWKKDSRSLFLEIGMGKGRFIIESAIAHPENDYLGMERYESVLFRACERMAGKPYQTPLDKKNYEAHPEILENFVTPSNLYFLDEDAKSLPEIFDKGEIDRIYLNFSDPWPKRAHRKRRLTHENYLKLYRRILSEDGEILVRTDAASLMEFTLTEMTNHGFSLVEVSFDLHSSEYFDGFTTEYEEKKSREGAIYYARFALKK